MNITNTVSFIPVKENQNAKIMPFNKASNSENLVTEESDSMDGRRAEELKKAEGTNDLKDTRTPFEKQNEEEEAKLTQEVLEEISHDFDTLHSVGLNFSRHDDTGRTMVKVMNRDTDELIREIPAKEVLDMAAKMDEMIGLLFDKKV